MKYVFCQLFGLVFKPVVVGCVLDRSDSMGCKTYPDRKREVGSTEVLEKNAFEFSL